MRKSGPKVVARLSARDLAENNCGTIGNFSSIWFQQIAEKGFGAILLDGVFSGPGKNESSPEGAKGFYPAREIGGENALADFREKAREAGLKTLGVFQGNHVEKSSPLPLLAPEWMMGGGGSEIGGEKGVIGLDLGNGNPCYFFEGKDPNFPPISGTLQINASHPGVRKYLASVFGRIGTFLDGLYCSQAMLVLGENLEKTWGLMIKGPVPGARELDSPWPLWIESARDIKPDFLALAEVYWGLEWALMQDGFDHCLDQRMLDRVGAWDLAGLGEHLSAPWEFLGKTQHSWPGRQPFTGNLFSAEEMAHFALFLFTPGLKVIRPGKGVPLSPGMGGVGEVAGWEDVGCLIRMAGKLGENHTFHLIERPGIPGDTGSDALVLGWLYPQGRQSRENAGEVVLIANSRAGALASFIPWDRLGRESPPGRYQMVLAGNQATTSVVCEVESDGLRYNLPGKACLMVQLG